MDVAKSLAGALALASALVSAPAAATSIDNVLFPRALPDSPSGNYAPSTVDCPASRPVLRGAGQLSPNETAWLPTRRNATVAPMTDFLKRANITGFDVDEFMSAASKDFSALPNIAITASGGGYRALMNGAGFIAAADNRVAGSTSPGGIGGLLQASTYLAGLSGGGWLVGSIYANNFSTVPELQAGSSDTGLWAFSRNILEGPVQGGNTGILGTLSSFNYWQELYDQVQEKDNAGYDTTITDYWGRALSFQLINTTDGGLPYTFSSISRTPGFNDAQQPLPILVADERSPGTYIVSVNSTIFEFNPWELGSWDPTVYGFAPLEYLGSNFTNGSLPTDQKCVRGFDQFGFVMGTSSSLFNAILIYALQALNIPEALRTFLNNFGESLDKDDDDIAKYTPNPFYGWNTASNPNANDKLLTLVDGGEDLQNVPLHPLIQPARAVDVIFAIDSSADTTTAWPNGTSLRVTHERSLAAIANGTQFPDIPSAETFINLGLNLHPTAFGCSSSSNGKNPSYPLVVYVPNAPYSALSNVSTFDLEYSDEQRNAIIQNGYNVATMGNGTVDRSWPTCVGCLVLQRSLVRSGRPIPDACQACYSKVCWNGTVNDTPVTVPYAPPMQLGGGSGGTGNGVAQGAQTGSQSGAVRTVGKGGLYHGLSVSLGIALAKLTGVV